MTNQYKTQVILTSACLMLTKGDKLVDYKFYNHFEFEEVGQDQFQKDTVILANKEIKKLIPSMFEEYREKDGFSKESLDEILQLADFTDVETSKLINKFHHINTQITSNGGVPVLKQILKNI